jgi:two-component system, OmpR family, sensor histidine kinase MtrB
VSTAVDPATSGVSELAAPTPLSSLRHRIARAQALVARFNKHRLGLRNRILAFYALGAFGLSMLLATTTFTFTRSTLVRQREESATRQAYQNAQQVRTLLLTKAVIGNDDLNSLTSSVGSNPLVHVGESWAFSSAQYGPESLPLLLRQRVGSEFKAAKMLSNANGRPTLAIGIPIQLTAVDASYYEVVELDELKRTLRSIGVSLIGAAAITTCLGVLLGSWAARRTMRPLAEAAQAATALAGGKLDTRLAPPADSDLGTLTAAFNGMADALQDRVERDARFASDVSHELRSPLMTLSASIEVMQARRDEMPERAAAALDLLVGDVNRFRVLVEDLLEISRFDAGKVRLHMEELLVAEFVRQAVSVSSIPSTPIRVSDIAESIMIRGDKRRLARAIANLIDNARNHGGGDVTVRVDVPDDEASPDPADPATVTGEQDTPTQPFVQGIVAHVNIEVEDHGDGVVPEERTIVFQRFARGARSGQRGAGDGAGLGLALVDEHVRLHGGRVWVTDRRDGEPGARFIIELPAELI